MAYAFNKVEDYFRRGKTGQMGSLQKGTEGAPPPTAAAQNLAKQAETSAEQGNATTNAYRAARGSNTTAMQESLVKPQSQIAYNWGEEEKQRVRDYLSGGEKKIEETYKAPENLQQKITQAASGEAPAAGELRKALAAPDLTFQPYQTTTPEFGPQQQLLSGVGGIQAALQKGKGGRYTAGMGALDASLLAGNREAMQGVQQQLGGIYEGTRQTAAQNIKTQPDKLKEKASEASTNLKKTVSDQIMARLPEFKAAQTATAQKEAEAQADRERAALVPQAQDYLRNELLAQGLTQADIDRMGTAEFQNQYGLYNPGTMGIAQESLIPQDLYAYTSRTGPMASYTSNTIDPRYAQLAGLLGINPVGSTVQYQQYGFDRPGIEQLAGSIAGQYRGVNQMIAQRQAAAAEAEAMRQTQSWAAQHPNTTVDAQGNTTTKSGSWNPITPVAEWASGFWRWPKF